MAKWHEPFLWGTIKRVGEEEFPQAPEHLQEKIYDWIFNKEKGCFTIAMIEDLYTRGLKVLADRKVN